MADCNSPNRPSSPLLPAFGIRHLNGPEAPPGTIQITGGQYRTTIRSQPDATLRYIDDDDGELITVGSSLELQERLDDPLNRPSRYRRRTLSENQMMHIFDIQKSAGCLAVWRDHEAYSSKSLREDSPPKDDVTDPEAPVSPISLEPSFPTTPIQLKPETIIFHDTQQDPFPTGAKNASHASFPHEQVATQLDQALEDICGGIQAQLGPLADFLETAADGLRKAAEKTAESDTTAIENVLTGFWGIWSELGQMGREFLESIDEQIQNEDEPKATAAIVPERPNGTHMPPLNEPSASPKLETNSKRVSFIEAPLIPAGRLSTAPPLVPNRFTGSVFGPAPSFNAGAQMPMLPPSMPIRKAHTSQGNFPKNSILDWETPDPDFSTRYPPLLSLRKAKSVSEIHAKGQVQSASSDSLAAGSALSRFPTINQFEQQSRSKVKIQNTSMKQDDVPGSSSLSSKPKSTTYKKPTVEDASTDTPSVKRQNPSRPSWSPTSLPGSWPEPKTDDLHASHHKTSYARTSLPIDPPQVSTSKDSTFMQTLPGRLSSPVSETYSRAPIFPRRHQTVSSANPAARLNGPFDPLANFPALQPRPQRSHPDLKLPRNTVNGRPIFEPSNVHIPGSFPQRSHTVHHTERYKPHPAPFNHYGPTVYGQNFRTPANNPAPSFSPLPRLETARSDDHMRPPPPTTSGMVHQQIFNLPSQRPMQSVMQPRPLVVHPLVRPERSEPNLASFTSRPPPSNVTIPTTRFHYPTAPPPEQAPTASTAVKECIQTLRSMGYGTNAHELARLNIYAGVAAGNIEEAIEMIEEDREAAKELDDSKNLEQIRDMDR